MPLRFEVPWSGGNIREIGVIEPMTGGKEGSAISDGGVQQGLAT